MSPPERVTHSPTETGKLASEVASTLEPGTVVALVGDLGTGKTAFAKGLAQALGVKATISSPTYTIIAEYPADPPFVHMDLYRLQDSEEFELLGVEEYFAGEAIVVIEWAERAADALPRDRTIWIRIRFGEGDRRIFDIGGCPPEESV